MLLHESFTKGQSERSLSYYYGDGMLLPGGGMSSGSVSIGDDITGSFTLMSSSGNHVVQGFELCDGMPTLLTLPMTSKS